jgi:hypothetical protein
MGDNCRIEDVNIKLISTSVVCDLTAIEFPVGTSQTSKLRTSVVTVDNKTIIYPTDVYGVNFSGTNSLNESTFSFNAIKGCTINVYSNSGGDKRGILVSGECQVSIRDTNIYVATPEDTASTGDYRGIETNSATGVGSIQIRTSSIAGPEPQNPLTYETSDIKQTTPGEIIDPTYLASPGIQIGPGTDLVTKSAGGQPFSTYTYPTTLFYGCRGVITNTQSGWLWPGTQFFSNSTPKYPDDSLPPARYRCQQPLIASGIMITANKLCVSPDEASIITVYLCKNASTNTPNGTTGLEVTMGFGDLVAGTEFRKANYNISVDFAQGDYISLWFVTTSTTVEDVIVQLDLF